MVKRCPIPGMGLFHNAMGTAIALEITVSVILDNLSQDAHSRITLARFSIINSPFMLRQGVGEHTMKRSTRTAITATLTVPFLTATTMVPSASALSPRFTLRNLSGHTLTRFYASPSHTRNWEEDILGSGILRSGYSVKVTINDGRRTCWYDFKSVFSGGQSINRYNVNVCSTGTYTIY